MKKVLILAFLFLLLTGCTKIDSDIDKIVIATMSNEIENVNTVSTGYELYIPIGVTQLVDSEYNQKFKIRDTHVYLYVDTVSYYHKYKLNYETKENSYNYYYKSLILNDKINKMMIAILLKLYIIIRK